MFKKLTLASVLAVGLIGATYAAGHHKVSHDVSKAKQSLGSHHQSKTKKATHEKVNINTADEKGLMALPHVGTKMALRILDYRKQYGRFKTLDDLTKVRGISKKRIEAMKGVATLS
jgi:competence protein ComEA